MQRVEFKYYLRYKVLATWHYYYVDTNGDVQNTTTPTELEYTPKGWEDIRLTWERGFVYHGVFQTYSTPLEFVNDGAKILRYLFVNYGTEGACQLFITKFNNTIATYAYEDYYMGDIDFSRYVDKKDFVQCETMEGGFMARLKANETTDFELDVVESLSRVWVNMEGVELNAIFTFAGIEQAVDNAPPTFTTSRRENFPTFLYALTEGYSNGDHNPKGNDFIGTFSQMFSQTYAGADIITVNSSDKWIIHNVSDSLSYDYKISGLLNIDQNNNALTARNINVFVYVNGAAALGGAVVKTTIATGGNIPGLGSLTESIALDYTITLAPNEQMWIFFRHTGAVGDVDYHISSANLTISVVNKVKQAYIPALRSFDVITELIARISGSTTVDSTLLQTTEAKKVLTCGDAVRGLEKSQLKTNVGAFYKSVDALFNTAMQYNKTTDTLYIKDKADSYDNATQILDLGTVNNLIVTPATDLQFAKLKLGYPEYSNDDFNGKDEVNLQQKYQTPLIRVTGEFDIVSDYHGSMYEITFCVANLVGKTQADSDNDNTVFWLDIEATPAGTIPTGLPGAGEDYYNLERSGYTVTSGLESPLTAFNLFLSPKLMMYRHGNQINSRLYPQEDLGGDITFQTSNKTQNNEDYLVWDISGTTYYEKRTEALTDLDTAIFYPIYFEFDSMIPQNILSLLNSNPYGKIKFTYNDLDYYGFLVSVSDSPHLTPKQSYKLLCSTSTNLDNLIV